MDQNTLRRYTPDGKKCTDICSNHGYSKCHTGNGRANYSKEVKEITDYEGQPRASNIGPGLL